MEVQNQRMDNIVTTTEIFKNCNVVVLNSEMQKDMHFRKKDVSRALRYKLGHLVCRRSGIFTKKDGILLQKNTNSNSFLCLQSKMTFQ